MFIIDLADDFLDDVFDGHDAGKTTVFVENKRKMAVVAVHLVEQRIEFTSFRDHECVGHTVAYVH